jgi:hypothetical protein
MTFSTLLNKTCTIQKQTKTQTGTGSVSVSWTTRASGVKTRCSPQRSAGVSNELGTVTVVNYNFYFEPTVTIEQSDRIYFESEYYEITLVSKVSNNHHIEVLTSKVSLQ